VVVARRHGVASVQRQFRKDSGGDTFRDGGVVGLNRLCGGLDVTDSEEHAERQCMSLRITSLFPTTILSSPGAGSRFLNGEVVSSHTNEWML